MAEFNAPRRAGAVRAGDPRGGARLDGALPEMDGKRHYVRLQNAPRTKKQGMSQGFADGWPAGFVVNYCEGIERRWKAEAAAHVTMSPAEQADMARKAREKLEQRRAEKLSQDVRTAAQAREMLDQASPAPSSHQYIRRKRISPDGLLQDRPGRLVVPMHNADGDVWNVQLIAGSGRKWYLPGRKHDLWQMLGQAVNGKPFGIVEGLATGKTVREATGMLVAVAFDSGNMLPVAQALRGLYPASPIKIFGDDDRFLPERLPALPNVGREKAIEAAAAVGGEAVFPTFPSSDLSSTDFNDLAHVIGIEAVRLALSGKGAMRISYRGCEACEFAG